MLDSPVTEHAKRRGDGRPAGHLVGRDEDVGRVRAFLDAARTDGAALLVTGEPGLGKTELLDAAADAATEADFRILRAAGIQFEAGISFSGLNQVLLPLLDTLTELPAIHRDALNVALGFGEGPPPSQLVVSNATLVLLRHAAESRPLLVILDDLQWLDRTSAGVLSFVARRLAASRVGLIGASRTAEEDFFDHAGLPELVVEPLDEAASRTLLETSFPDLDASVLERILVEAQGNPLALRELPIALGPFVRASADALPSTLPLGRRLDALFGARISELPAGTRQLLLLMALDGTGDLRVLGAGAARNEGFRALAPAEQARIAYVDERARRLSFRHPLMRSAVVGLSQAEERRTAHLVLAGLVADQPDRRAWHLAQAAVEPEESVAAELEAAAGRILARGDAVGAVKALTRSAELSPRNADRHRRLAAAAFVGAEVTGELGRAAQVLAELRRGEVEFEASLQAAIAASAVLLSKEGDVPTAHRLLVGAIESQPGTLDARDPVVAEALYSLLLVCSYGWDDELWRPFEVAMARTEGVPRILDLSMRTFADPAHAGTDAIEALDAAIATISDETDPTLIVRMGVAATYVDRLEGCRGALWRVVGDAREGRAVASGFTAMILLASDDLSTGQWDEAEQLIDEALSASVAYGYSYRTWPCRFLQVVLAGARGDDERVETLTAELVDWAAPRKLLAGQRRAWQARGLAALGRGDFEEAYHQASNVSAPGALPPHVPHALFVLFDLVEAAVRTGRHAEAQAHVAAMNEANLAAVSSRLALVVGGSTAMAAPDDDALELYEAALALPGIERWPFDVARVRLAYGERLRRSRATMEARVQLNAALETFARLRARRWVDRANTELRATGTSKPRRRDTAPDRLTPQEFEISKLAASGLTNKQIAERLFVSPRTVGGHLYQAFPKLGVSTRAGLHDALASLPATEHPSGN